MDQNSLFRFAVDTAMNMVIVFDDTGTILYANQSAGKALEYYEELIMRPITEIFPAEFEIHNGEISTECRLDGTYQEIIAYRKNRTCFPIKAQFRVHNESARLFAVPGQRFDDLPLYGGQRSYICTGYDATKEIFMEKKVSNADKEVETALRVKSEFIANVTHELRTPVNGILGNAMELLNRVEDKEEKKFLDLIERGCRDMHSIINNVLDFSKLEAGKFTLEPREFNFRNMIDYVKGNHYSRITEKGLDFSITISDAIPEYVVGDELRIVQILNNLISNAYKFTSIGAIHVEVIKTAQDENRMELFFMVMDSGIGIAKADQDKLFKSFSQVDASISRKYGGTGLGLNICKQLVELMGGNIHVESTVGKGSTFSFQIWVEIPDEELPGCSQEEEKQVGIFISEYTGSTDHDATELIDKLQNMTEPRVSDHTWEYGSPENMAEIEKKMSKLILSIEMDNWEKAEMFMEAVKQLTDGGPREVKSAGLRMKMAVQKGDYEKAVAAFELLKNSL